MRITLVCWTIALAALGAGCSRPSQAQTDLETHRALFSQAGFPSYTFIWLQDCDCDADSTRAIEVTVSGRDVVSAVYLDDRQPVSESVRRGLKTVDGVFDLIADRLDDADDVYVLYDTELNYPSVVSVTAHKTIASDDDLSLQLFNFVTPVEPPEPADTGKPALRTQLATQRALFVEPTSYSFTSMVSCYCGPGSGLPIRVSVVDGAITRAVYRDNQQPISDTRRASLMTLPGLFDDIETQLADDSGWRSNELAFDYDPVFHYPTRMQKISKIADAGSELYLSDFVTPADAPASPPSVHQRISSSNVLD